MATQRQALHHEASGGGGAQRRLCAPLIAKLNAAAELSEADEHALCEMWGNTREFAPRRHILREGDNPHHVHVVLEGWAARYKDVADGSRQITAFLLPGDFCDLHVRILGEMDHSILALTRATVAQVPHGVMAQLPINRPTLARAFWGATLVDEAVLRSWIVNIGRRDAAARIAHLFCELHARLQLVGLVANHQFTLPLTQEVIADAVGLTPVHVNRMMKRLRTEGFIAQNGGELTILDPKGLGNMAGFDPNYLHRGRLARR